MQATGARPLTNRQNALDDANERLGRSEIKVTAFVG